MSNSPYFHISDVDTGDIHERVKDIVDTSKLDKELIIRYKKFPIKLPCMEDTLKQMFKRYYELLSSEGYRYNIDGELDYEIFLVISPPWTNKTWTKKIKCNSSNMTNVVNMHIILNDSNTVFSYFCPFNDDTISIPCKKNTVIVYPEFWGSIFKHSCTYEHSTMYLWCVMGLLQ